jgi:aspartyl-tRNA(Asn)/glutamyl-tRNA(Gln) amidotransferase subunit B
MKKYEITIGIECHVQLSTKTKLFSEVDNDARGKEPNSCVSPVDYALPGMLPRLNKAAIEYAVRAGHALNSEINALSRFDRKHYYYPDSPKGYQITQFYHPIIGAGFVELPDGSKVRIEHAHLEGDAGKLTHFDTYSLVDLNRVDTPLIEIVSMPDIHSARAAHDYCKELWRVMTYAGVTYGDLYNGNMRFDVNISLALPGAKELGTRAEIKNLNSFRSVEKAVEYEYKRQSRILDEGGKVKQETRGYSDATGETTSQRSKEEAQDYRYMPEPDLPPVHLTQEYIDQEKSNLPLMPHDYRVMFKDLIPSDTLEVLLDYPQLMRKLGELSSGQANGQTRGRSEPAGENKRAVPVKTGDGDAARDLAVRLVANLFSSLLLAEENASLLNDDLPTAKQLLDLSAMNSNKELSSTATKQVFLKFFDPEMHHKDTKTIAKELGVIQENDSNAIEAFVDQVIADPANKKAVDDYKSGQEKVLGFLVGQVMKVSKGKANPSSAREILIEKLK